MRGGAWYAGPDDMLVTVSGSQVRPVRSQRPEAFLQHRGQLLLGPNGPQAQLDGRDPAAGGEGEVRRQLDHTAYPDPLTERTQLWR